MTTGIGPYVVPDPTDTDPAASVLETTIVADETPVDIGGGTTANAQTFNGTIPGPTFRLNVGDTVIVRLINRLEHPTGIHWHGIELENSADGTPFTQDQAEANVPGILSGRATFLYKFKVTRPGLYWYHPHHHASTNQVFKGLYGMIIVTDPNEAALIVSGVLPGAADTKQLVLSDVTVCKAPGSNDALTYNLTLPWVGVGGTLPAQAAPTPVTLCEIPTALNEDGTPHTPSFAAGDIPNIQNLGGGRTNEGQTVLTNGMNVGARAGSPGPPGALPGALAPGSQLLNVQPGQGLRLQIANTAAVRYFRLILTGSVGGTVVQVPLVRVGGEGGLLDNAVVEGGVIPDVIGGTGNFDTKYTSGEILLPPASRADVVAAIPATAAGVLTLWTQDYSRTGLGFSNIATVPVMHLNVAGAAVSPAYTIAAGTALRAATGAPVETLGAATAVLLNPGGFAPPKLGMSSQDIRLTQGGGMLGIDGIMGTHDVVGPYTGALHLGSSRYAKVGVGEILQLTVTNTTNAHHPFHLHGFSMQPISLTKPASPTFTWPYREFRDNIDIPSGYTLTFRIRIDDRMLEDGVTPGGAFGRWIFHCHIFFHAHLGMIGELVTTAANGNEKPNVNVAGSWAYTPSGGIAVRHGTFSDPDGDTVTLAASLGTVTDTGGGTWSWTLDTKVTPTADGVYYVYITATDSGGRKDQTVFRLKIGAPDDGSDNGDPHISTVDGKLYDFQAVGEFTLLRDADGLEIQVRQTPVPTATPIVDSYSGLTSCVSVNTAVAARVGSHRIAYQPIPDNSRVLRFFLDGKRAKLSTKGIDLGGARITAHPVGDGATAIRVDYENAAVLTITPWFWNSYNIWLLNVSVSHTAADEGIMGSIPQHSWLPALPNGATVGPKPASLHKRYVVLYQTFANAWRVTNKTSLFVYARGTSTKTFTDTDWPAEKPPCKLKPQFQIPGAHPSLVGIKPATAKRICKPIKFADLNRGCVFDVATTGDKTLVKSYLLAQELRLNGSTVQIVGDKDRTRPGETVLFTATAAGMSRRRPIPTGRVTFMVDGVAAGPPVQLDKRGRACLKTARLGAGAHRIRAVYTPGGKNRFYRASTSPNLLHTVAKTKRPPRRAG